MTVYDSNKNQNSPTKDEPLRNEASDDIEQLRKGEAEAHDTTVNDTDGTDSLKDKEQSESSTSSKAQVIQPNIKSVFGFAKKNKGKVIGGGIVAGFLALFAFGILTLGSYKLETMLNNIQDRFGAGTQNATNQMTQKLFTNYIIRTMWAERCGGRNSPLVNRDCTAYNGNSLVGKLYTGWRQAKVEDQIFKKYGYSFEYDTRSGSYKMFKLFPDGTRDRDVLDLPNDIFDRMDGSTTFDEYLKYAGTFDNVTRNQIRDSLDTSLKAGTWYDRTLFRIKVARFVQQKYGVKLCIVACFIGRDRIINSFNDWKDSNSITRAAKRWFAQRVLQPKNELYGLIMQCLYSSPDICDPRRVVEAEPSDYSANEGGCLDGCDQNGEALSENDKNRVQNRLIYLAATNYGSDKEKLEEIFNRFNGRGGFIALAIRSMVNRVDDVGDQRGGNATENNSRLAQRLVSRLGERAIPIIGWVLMASDAIMMIDFADKSLPKLQYQAQEVAAVQAYMMFKTHRDEVREGLTDANLTGSFAKMLEGGNQTEDGSFNDKQLGGHGSAESSPVYQDLVATGQPVEYRSPIAKLFSQKATAADDGNLYECANYSGNDGNYVNVPIETGKKACPEESFNQRAPLSRLAGAINIGLLRQAAAIVDRLLGWIDDALGYLIATILNELGLSGVIDNIVGALLNLGPIREVLKFVAMLALGPGLFNTDLAQSGARTMQLMVAGADATFNKFNQNGIGGVALSSKQVSENIDYYYEGEQLAYSQKPLLARIFDIHDNRSVLAKLSVSVPSGSSSSLGVSILSGFSSSIRSLGNIFTGVLNIGRSADAQTISYEDPFGITQYGYALDDPVFDKDPEKFWVDNCTTESDSGTDTSQWSLTKLYNTYASLNIDGDTKMPRNDRPNPNDPDPVKADLARRILAVSPTGTNGCLLIQASVGAAGAIFTDEVLSPEERAPAGSAGGGGGVVDCSATTGIDQSAGNAGQTNGHASLIASRAPRRSCPGTPTPAGAIPGDPALMYFSYDGCSDGCNDQGQTSCQANNAGTKCIKVQYRDPPGSGNTIFICYEGCGGASASPATTNPPASGTPATTTPPASGCGFNDNLGPSLGVGSIFSFNPYFGVILC